MCSIVDSYSHVQDAVVEAIKMMHEHMSGKDLMMLVNGLRIFVLKSPCPLLFLAMIALFVCIWDVRGVDEEPDCPPSPIGPTARLAQQPD